MSRIYSWPNWNSYVKTQFVPHYLQYKEVTFCFLSQNLRLNFFIIRFFTSVSYCCSAYIAKTKRLRRPSRGALLGRLPGAWAPDARNTPCVACCGNRNSHHCRVLFARHYSVPAVFSSQPLWTENGQKKSLLSQRVWLRAVLSPNTCRSKPEISSAGWALERFWRKHNSHLRRTYIIDAQPQL